MSSKLSRPAFEQLIAEDIAWLEKQPRTLEREHIIMCVREAVTYYYVEAQDEAIKAAREKALRPLEVYEIEKLSRKLGMTSYSRDVVFRLINELLESRQGHP